MNMSWVLFACRMEEQLGTIAYTAPETFADKVLNKPADVYAFGIMREWLATLTCVSKQAQGGWPAEAHRTLFCQQVR
jgi:hypothetical protein